MQSIYYALNRMNGFYRYSKTDMRRLPEDIDKNTFQEVFKEVVPEPFASDVELTRRMGDLCKFIHLTYFVASLANPFETSDKPTIYDKFKRSI